MVGFQLLAMLIQPLLNVGNNILDIMVARHGPTMWLILIGIRVSELVDLGSEVYIRWAIIILRFIIFLDSIAADDNFHGTLESRRIHQNILT